MDAKFDDRLWAVVVADGARFMGVVGDNLTDQYGKPGPGTILEAIKEGDPVQLSMGCELPIPLQSGPQGIGRAPLAVGIDLTLDPVPIYLCRISSIYFIKDLSEEDQKILFKLHTDLMGALKAVRAQRSGLILGLR